MMKFPIMVSEYFTEQLPAERVHRPLDGTNAPERLEEVKVAVPPGK